MTSKTASTALDKAAHLSVILDLSPVQWHLSAADKLFPLDLQTFMSHLFAFLNAHVASKHENSLAVFGAFPGKRWVAFDFRNRMLIWISMLLYSSTDKQHLSEQTLDSNSYLPFKTINATILDHITEELDLLANQVEKPCALVGAMTKALCCMSSSLICEIPRLTSKKISTISTFPPVTTARFCQIRGC